jgi:hypothetical protein
MQLLLLSRCLRRLAIFNETAHAAALEPVVGGEVPSTRHFLLLIFLFLLLLTTF